MAPLRKTPQKGMSPQLQARSPLTLPLMLPLLHQLQQIWRVQSQTQRNLRQLRHKKATKYRVQQLSNRQLR